jgi:hypothetical protein
MTLLPRPSRYWRSYQNRRSKHGSHSPEALSEGSAPLRDQG